VQTTVSTGSVTITNQGVILINTTESTKWLFDTTLDWNRSSDYATFHVPNRQLIGGVGVGDNRQEALIVALRWGMSPYADSGLPTVRHQAESLEADDPRAIRTVMPSSGTSMRGSAPSVRPGFR
jgi:hypothetical protein